MPAAPVHPLAWLGALRRGLDHRDDLVPGPGFSHLEIQLRFADVGHGSVALDEPRDHELPGGVDQLRLRADESLNRRPRTQLDDSIAADGDRLRLWHRVIDRHDLGVGYD